MNQVLNWNFSHLLTKLMIKITVDLPTLLPNTILPDASVIVSLSFISLLSEKLMLLGVVSLIVPVSEMKTLGSFRIVLSQELFSLTFFPLVY